MQQYPVIMPESCRMMTVSNDGMKQMCHAKELAELLGCRDPSLKLVAALHGEALQAATDFIGRVGHFNRKWRNLTSQQRVAAKSDLADLLPYLYAYGLSVYAMERIDPQGKAKLVVEVRTRVPLDRAPLLGNRIRDLDDRDREMKPYYTWWDGVSWEDRDDLESAIESASREGDMQSFLEERPRLLVQHLYSGHGRWVFPQRRLGSEHVTDFLIAARDSMGYSWTAVELESPLVKPFTQRGDPSRSLTHAQRQITDWRNWLRQNANYASRRQDEQGLGLPDIDSDIDGLIIIGRRNDYARATAHLRRDLKHRSNIEVRSYEWLIDNLETRLRSIPVPRAPGGKVKRS